MSRELIIQELEGIFKEITGDEELKISENTVIGSSIGDDVLQISSLDFVQAVIAIEEHFKIIIDFDLPLSSVKDIVVLIENEGK